MKLGVCYYPEQWPETMWADDARAMVELGISTVRIGEFAWSRLEPDPGRYDWAWLDRAIETLGKVGLEVILGTPTATPPKWLIDLYPDCLARDVNGQLRKFGSRRHYCFSSRTYRRETARIVTAIATRYGHNSAVTGWQTDNEYGCHDTVRSYSDEALQAFRGWLAARHPSIDALNEAWGTNFWSQTYRHFDEIDLPNLTVTEANPSHWLDFYRFSSDQVVSYNRLQTVILRALSPDREIYHNFMGHFTDFDHFAVGRDIDVAAWDSYPLGFLDQQTYRQTDKRKFMRQGHPDFAGFHHDLYRACGKGRLAIMEQQPGPVNWAPNNPAPLPGMVRLWGHETRAHGGELFSVFRWRQAPFAQENMHAAIMRRDNQPAPAHGEVRMLADDLSRTRLDPNEFGPKSDVALMFSYETQWMSQIKPQGTQWDYFRLAMDWYSGARQLGLNLDIIAPGTDLSGYKVVLIPALMHVENGVVESLKATNAQIIFGPRSGAYTRDMQIPENLAPGPLQSLIPLKVIFSESLPADHSETGSFNNQRISAHAWLDHIETSLMPLALSVAGKGLAYQHSNIVMLTCVPDAAFLLALIEQAAHRAGLAPACLASGLRTRRGHTHQYTVNYGPNPAPIANGNLLNDGELLQPAGVALRRN